MYETMFESKMDNYLVETYEQAVFVNDILNDRGNTDATWRTFDAIINESQ
jgi:PBP1b-binding outer membrane lipoprotein LpoB